MKDIEKEEPMCSTDSDDMDQEKPEHRSGKMFIGGLHSQTDSDSLENYFKQYGAIKECVIMRDPCTRRSRGFGFVTFSNPSSVDKVVKKTNHMVDGKKVDPKIAIPRKVPKQNQFKKIFIGGLASDTTTNDIREYFEKYGKVTDVLLMYDKQTRRLRGFGFVSFESEEVAKRICGEGFHKIKSKSVECKRAQPKEVMQALQGRGRAGPYFGVDLSQIPFPRWYTQYGTPMPFYSGQEWPQMYQQLAKMEEYNMALAPGRWRERGRSAAILGYQTPGFHSFPPGSGGFMNMAERRAETSPQHGYYRSSFGSVRNPDVRARSDQNPPSNSVTSSSISSMQDYEYGVPMNQYHQHGQSNLAPNPSPLSHAGINPINSPGPVEYISATRTGAAAPHDFAVYSNSVGFGNGMTSLRQ